MMITTMMMAITTQDENDLKIMTAIDELYTMHPYFGVPVCEGKD